MSERAVDLSWGNLRPFARMRESAEDAAELLRSMGSSHRLMILCLLMEGPRTVTEVCEALDARQSLVSQHLIRLRQSRLVKAERKGNFVEYSIADSPAGDIVAILQSHFCNGLLNNKKRARRN
jgi:DNA-binding transcriptional ArsR family regulator